MASAVIDSSEQGLSADPLPDFVMIRTDEVDRGERLRPIDPVWAEALGQVMKREGQRTPVEVCRLPGTSRWTLVSGGHRHAGAELSDIEYLRAEIVSAGKDDRRLREVSENLWRRDLAPIDRAAFIAEAVAIHKRRAGIDPAKDGRSASAQVRWQKAVSDEAADATETISIAYGWSDEIGEQLGFTGRTIRNDLMLYRRLAPSVIAKLREHRHPAADNATQLRSLAKLELREQEKVAELLVVPGASLNYGQPKTIAEAIAHPLGPKPARPVAVDEKRLSTFIGTYQRMALAEKKGALPHLAPLLPSGFAITEGAPPNASLSPDHEKYRAEALETLDDALEFVDGMIEDEVLTGERGEMLDRLRGRLHLTRITIAGDGFAMEPRP